MNENLLKIINHYGVMKQLKYFQSEIFELNEAIIFFETQITTCDEVADESYIKMMKDHIIEELADVQVMLNQFREYYGINTDDIKNVAIAKIDRQLERIEKEGE